MQFTIIAIIDLPSKRELRTIDLHKPKYYNSLSQIREKLQSEITYHLIILF